jgi:hypothetical protein
MNRKLQDLASETLAQLRPPREARNPMSEPLLSDAFDNLLRAVDVAFACDTSRRLAVRRALWRAYDVAGGAIA